MKKIITIIITLMLCLGTLSACGKVDTQSLAKKWNREAEKENWYDQEEEPIEITGEVIAEDKIYKIYDSGILEIIGEYSLEEEDMPQEIVDKILEYDFDKVYITGENIRFFPKLEGKSFDVYLDESVCEIADKTFFENEQIQKLVIYGNDICIRDFAFKGCTQLEEVWLMGNIKAIGEEAFSECINLKTAMIHDRIHEQEEEQPEEEKDASQESHEQEVEAIDESLIIEMKDGIFKGCKKLENVKLPTPMLVVPDEMFQSCEKLKEINLPETIKIIGENAFYDCISLSSITWPKNLEQIHEKAFYECCSLESIELPKRVTVLEKEVFGECVSLKKLTIGEQLKEYAEENFSGADVEIEYFDTVE